MPTKGGTRMEEQIVKVFHLVREACVSRVSSAPCRHQLPVRLFPPLDCVRCAAYGGRRR